MLNIPAVKLGIIAVSRGCFPKSISERRLNAVASAFQKNGGDLYQCQVIVEDERDAVKALEDVKVAGVNALVVFLGNFGPETPETQIAQHFKGPVMFVGASEENIQVLSHERGDAYCGMLNCSYNLGLRNLRAYIPEQAIGTAEEIADRIAEFIPLAAAMIGLKSLKILAYGPRPNDFLACNAPIKPLFDLGVEIEEHSELDLLVEFRKHQGDPRIPDVVLEMEAELGRGNTQHDLLMRLAQYELTLLDLIETHKGNCQYVALANKCWPAFQTEFHFVPCYVNSRLASRGFPVACETDIYGALSEYIGTCLSASPVTLLDINNTVPQDLYDSDIRGRFNYRLPETFMGFHCGNTPLCRLSNGEIKHQLIMKRLLEPDNEPDITRGTLEGDIAPGDVALFRLQSTAEGHLKAYVAQGEILPVATHSFGSIGIIAVSDMERFYRHVLIEKRFPHHAAVAFGRWSRSLYEFFKLLGIQDISYNQPLSRQYKTENPFSS